MKLNLLQTLAGYDGQPILFEDTKEPVTLRRVLLLALERDDRDPAQRMTRYLLAGKIHGHDEADLTAEETALLKTSAVNALPFGVAGAIVSLIDPAALGEGRVASGQ